MAMEKLSGWDVVEILWPLNDMFRPRLREIRSLPYDASFEAAADDAIRAFAETPEAATWKTIPAGAWRVLLERHQQLLVVAMANEAAGNPMTVMPAGLSQQDRLAGLMLLLLLRMKLPFPAADRSRTELPEGSPPKSH